MLKRAALQSLLHKRSFCLSVSGWIAPSAVGEKTPHSLPFASELYREGSTRGKFDQDEAMLVVDLSLDGKRSGLQIKHCRYLSAVPQTHFHRPNFARERHRFSRPLGFDEFQNMLAKPATQLDQ